RATHHLVSDERLRRLLQGGVGELLRLRVVGVAREQLLRVDGGGFELSCGLARAERGAERLRSGSEAVGELVVFRGGGEVSGELRFLRAREGGGGPRDVVGAGGARQRECAGERRHEERPSENVEEGAAGANHHDFTCLRPPACTCFRPPSTCTPGAAPWDV